MAKAKNTNRLKRRPMEKNILITGLPGCGKTTLIKKLAKALKDLHPVGFYTAEIREEGVRKGFELISLDGRRGFLAHTDIKSHHRVGKYKVDIQGLENFIETISFFNPSARFIIIDEIGKMECLSDRFKKLLIEMLDSEKWIIATIALKGSGLIEAVKRRPDLRVFEINQSNRDTLFDEILNEISLT